MLYVATILRNTCIIMLASYPACNLEPNLCKFVFLPSSREWGKRMETVRAGKANTSNRALQVLRRVRLERRPNGTVVATESWPRGWQSCNMGKYRFTSTNIRLQNTHTFCSLCYTRRFRYMLLQTPSNHPEISRHTTRTRSVHPNQYEGRFPITSSAHIPFLAKCFELQCSHISTQPSHVYYYQVAQSKRADIFSSISAVKYVLRKTARHTKTTNAICTMHARVQTRITFSDLAKRNCLLFSAQTKSVVRMQLGRIS